VDNLKGVADLTEQCRSTIGSFRLRRIKKPFPQGLRQFPGNALMDPRC